MSVLGRCYIELFRKRIRLHGNCTINEKTTFEYVEPSIIIMSRETEYEIMRDDYRNDCGALNNTQPRTFCGVRVAYDDSLPLGDVIVGEILK